MTPLITVNLVKLTNQDLCLLERALTLWEEASKHLAPIGPTLPRQVTLNSIFSPNNLETGLGMKSNSPGEASFTK